MAVRNDLVWQAQTSHGTSWKPQLSLSVPSFRREDFEHLPFVAQGALQISSLAVELYENVLQVPEPLGNSGRRFCIVGRFKSPLHTSSPFALMVWTPLTASR